MLQHPGCSKTVGVLVAAVELRGCWITLHSCVSVAIVWHDEAGNISWDHIRMSRLTLLLTWLLLIARVTPVLKADEPALLKLAVFDVDATPPLGSAMAYDPVKRLDELTLRCRGIVLTGAGKPIVLCAVDWIGIANEGHDAFRDALAAAAGTTSRPRRGACPASARCAGLRLHGRAADARAADGRLRPLRRRPSIAR